MHPFFSITPEDIRRLTDEESRELVARLCRAELREQSVSQGAVTWGGDQRAKDGGVDVRVDVEPPMGISGYITRDRTAFQVKAERFNKAKIPKEMVPKGIIRPAIVELSKDNGAYVIVSTRDSLSASSILDRTKAMEKCMSEHGLAKKVIVDFYDCRKIADWIEQHPSIANWTKYILGIPLVGWQPYRPWAYKESDVEAEYLVDDRVKVFMPNADKGTDILSAINGLRSDLRKNDPVRIVGLSGVGKTRLVQALFDKRVCTESPVLDEGNVLYTDLSDNPIPQPNAMVEALISDGSDCVIVVDNCGQEVHQKLTETITSHRSNIHLLTVEYDIRDDLPEGTICYRLEGSSDEVIKKLLKRRYKVLSDNDLDKIAEFSDGNARVAYALASSTETSGELAQLRDSELFNRLFYQKHAENDKLLLCAEAASLLYSFDGEDISSSSELAMLASFVEVSVVAFAQYMAELYRRGLIQKRGKWRAVLPHAISNRLAMRAIEAIPKSLLIKVLIENASDRVTLSFSRRLSYLHESKAVREMVYEWLQPDGRFGEITSLKEIDRQIFTNIAPVHQQAALNSIDRASLDPNFVSSKTKDLVHFYRIVRSLAYEPSLFNQAVNILLRFAIAEPEKNNHDSSIHNILKSLFFCHLSGTEAQSPQRSIIVRELILSTDQKKQDIGLSLLNPALEARRFSSPYGFDFGARKRGYGWRPQTSDDLRAWYKPFIEIAVEVGKNLTPCGRQARVYLGNSVRGLWVNRGLTKEIFEAGEELLEIDGWPEGWLGARRILQYDKNKINETSLQELRKFEQLLSPQGLKEKIRAVILANGVLSDDLDMGEESTGDLSSRMRRAEQKAEDLGKIAAIEDELLSELLPELMLNVSNSKVLSFGIGVGQITQDATKLLTQVKRIVASADSRQVSFIFLRGFISGWHKENPKEVSSFLNGALYDEVWAEWFLELQLRVKLDRIDYERLLTSLELGKIPIDRYRNLSFGRVTAPLTVDQISYLIKEIAATPNGGLSVAIDVLYMAIFASKDNNVLDYRQNLANACVPFLQGLDWSLIYDDHLCINHLESILEFAITSSTAPKDEILTILYRLITYQRSDRFAYINKGKELLAHFCKNYPTETLDAVFCADEGGRHQIASSGTSLTDSDLQDSVFHDVPVEKLLEWCEVSPEDRYLFAAQTCCLIKQESADLCVHETANQVLAGARDKHAVLKVFIDRFYPTSYSGSLSANMRKNLPLFTMLNSISDETLDSEIRQAEEEFRKQIVETEIREEARERRQTESFE